MTEDSFAEKEKLLLRKHELEWANFTARRDMELARHRNLPLSEMIVAAVGVGQDSFELETAELKERQSRELLDLIKGRMAASAEREARLPDVEPPPTPRTRKEAVRKILEQKGWSVLDWANAAGVSHATAMDYLQGKTAPYKSSRLKLARALGITVDQLPK
jgi:ribosome-binding protein aMBF1 (putative translation factor)